MKKIDEEIRQTTSSLPVRLKARMNLNLEMSFNAGHNCKVDSKG